MQLSFLLQFGARVAECGDSAGRVSRLGDLRDGAIAGGRGARGDAVTTREIERHRHRHRQIRRALSRFQVRSRERAL